MTGVFAVDSITRSGYKANEGFQGISKALQVFSMLPRLSGNRWLHRGDSRGADGTPEDFRIKKEFTDAKKRTGIREAMCTYCRRSITCFSNP
jgi:hypothetical protein